MERAGMMVLLCVWAAAGVPAALAQTGKYPDRPIRLIVPWPPGGTVDVNARILGPGVSKSIGQQVVVDNRAGASGIIGTTAAAREKPDGYSLIINTTPMVTNTLMYSKVPYNLLKDFEAISILSMTPSFLSVHPSVPALIGAISGEVSIAYSGVAGAVQFVQSGRLRALGVTSPKPVAALPGVPPIAEAGLPGYEFVAWFLLAAPKGTPREIVLTLNEHFRMSTTFPETIKRFESEGIDVVGSTPEQAAATMESELKKYANLIRERGMKAE